MTSHAEQSIPAPKLRVFSPLVNAPKFSPPSSRNTSPLRRPLHDRSNSQTNQYAGPTIRIVEDAQDAGTDVYSKTPFPSQASQILPPRKRPGYAFEGRGARVSDASSVASVVAEIEARQTLVPKSLQHKKAFRRSTSTSMSDADTLVASLISPTSSRFSQGSTAPSSIYQEEKGLEVLQEESSPPELSTIRAVPPSTASSSGPDTFGSFENHALTPRASAASLASTESNDSLPYTQTDLERGTTADSGNYQTLAASTPAGTPAGHNRNSSSGSNKRKRASTNTAAQIPIPKPSTESFAYSEYSSASGNYQTLAASSPTGTPAPAANHSRNFSSGSIKRYRVSSESTVAHRPIPKASTESFAYSDYSYTSERPRSSSQPSPTIHDARHVTLASGVRVSYPIVRAPSASSLWAESQKLPKHSSRMNQRASQVHQWSGKLSTIASESERASRSYDRRSQSFDGRSHSTDEYPGDGRSHVPRRRRTISSIASSENVSSSVAESSVIVPLPLFSPITRPSNEERNSDERYDTVSPLQSPPLRNKYSFLRRHDSDSRSSSSRPGSSNSDFSTFIANTIPAWARVYYQRGERSSVGAPDNITQSTDSLRLPTAASGRTQTPSEGNFPFTIHRPRNRPRERMSDSGSLSISEAVVEQTLYALPPPLRRPISEPFTPRLRQDRRSTARLSAWKAPSLDESFGTLFFSRQNRQVLLFCLGFLCPFAWIIAAFLPLPPDPDMIDPTPSQMDIERQFTRQLGPVDDRSFIKATWWRNLNRIMAAIGSLLIGVIIALAILAARMS